MSTLGMEGESMYPDEAVRASARSAAEYCSKPLHLGYIIERRKMDRAELLEALEDLQGRLDVAPDGVIEDDLYTELSDAVDSFKDLVSRRVL